MILWDQSNNIFQRISRNRWKYREIRRIKSSVWDFPENLKGFYFQENTHICDKPRKNSEFKVALVNRQLAFSLPTFTTKLTVHWFESIEWDEQSTAWAKPIHHHRRLDISAIRRNLEIIDSFSIFRIDLLTPYASCSQFWSFELARQREDKHKALRRFYIAPQIKTYWRARSLDN